MAVEIGRSLGELDKKIKDCKAGIKDAQQETKAFDKALKLDPGNVDAARQKFAAMERQLKLTAEKEVALKEKQAQLKKEFIDGGISQQNYQKQMSTLEKELRAAENETAQLTSKLKEQNKEIRQANYEKMTKGLDLFADKTAKASRAAKTLVGALVSLLKASMETGDQLNDTAKKYDTTVEKLQIWENRLGMLASDQKAYETSLSSVGSMLSSIAAGRGTRYLSLLAQLGIAQEDLARKTNAQVFDLIFEGLQKVTDETDRSIIAQALLGDKGLEIAQVAGTQRMELKKLDAALLENGIITTEQAVAADRTANKVLGLRQQITAQGAELMTIAVPAIESFVGILKTLFGWLGNVSEGGMKIIMAGLLTIAMLPKLIALGKGVAAVIALINGVSTPWLGIITAISAALLVLISLLGVFNTTAADAAENASAMMSNVQGMSDNMMSMGADAQHSTVTSYNNNSMSLDVNVKAEGDGTAINEKNADVIAQKIEDRLMVDLINQGLGSVVR